MITFPNSVEQATNATGEFRAGGTDLQDRRRNNKATGPVIDLKNIPLNSISVREVLIDKDGSSFGVETANVDSLPTGLSIGARTSIATIAQHAEIQTGWPALARTARGLATPQIREVATIGGNLTQHTRCPYARHPVLRCAKSGGIGCPARNGDHSFGVVVDQGPCVAPHPSSLALALLIYDAEVKINETTLLPVASLWGDGSDPTRNHTLHPNELITSIHLPPAKHRERGGYIRAISRFEAEWPLAEAAVRVVTSPTDEVIEIGIAVGGVANTPLRLHELERSLIGKKLSTQVISETAQLATQLCSPLPDTGYKVSLLKSVIVDALHQISQTWML